MTLIKTMAGKVRPRVGALVVLALIGACGWGPSGSTFTTGSAARTASPNTTRQPPDAARLTVTNCSGPAANTATRLLGQYYTIRPAPNWTDTGDYIHTESLLLELTAPAGYGNSPTRIEFLAFPNDVKLDFGPQATAHSIAADEATTHQRFTSSQSTATLVSDCSVAADSAAAFGYADGNECGYWLLIVHHDRLLGVRLFGTGGIGDQAIQDALGMIGSVVWAY